MSQQEAEALFDKCWDVAKDPAELRRLSSELFRSYARRALAAEEVAHWAQAVLTALNVGDVAKDSPLHHKLREAMIAYRN